MKLILLSVLLVFVSINNTFTQENNISFERFSTDDGLNQTSVLTMYQDKDGFIWLGTYLGLNRYDGTKITSYRYNFINTDDISDMHIRSICPDTAGVLLLGTTTGLNIFFKQTKEFINYSHDPKDSNSLAHNIIYKVLKDSDGDIWLATLGGGLDKMEKIEGNYTDERDVKYRFIHYKPSADKNCISSLYISDLAEDANGNIWIATNNGLNRFDKKNKTFEVFKHEKGNNNSLPINDISKVLIDNNGIVWIGTWGGGLCAYNPNNKRFTRFKHNPSIPFSISHNIISSIYSDKKGNVWAGTWGGGLNKLVFPTDRSYIDVLADTPNEIKFINYKNSSTDLHSLSGNSVYSIFEDKTGFIWVGTDWAGVNRFRLGEERFHHFYAEKKQGNNLVSNVVYSLLLDGPDKLWIGTENGLNVYNRKTNDFILYQNIPGDKKSLSQNLVRTLLKDHENNIWVGTENGLNRYNRNTNEFERLTNIFNESEKGIITSLFESSNHELWIGTYSEGLVRYNLKDKTFKRYMNKPNDSTSLSGNIIWSVIEDSNNAIWVGAGDGGLCRLNKDNETFTQYKHDPDDSTSISNDLVLSLFYDKNNNIWIGTRSGLNKLVNAAENKPEFIHYYKSDGLSSGSISGISEDKTIHSG